MKKLLIILSLITLTSASTDAVTLDSSDSHDSLDLFNSNDNELYENWKTNHPGESIDEFNIFAFNHHVKENTKNPLNEESKTKAFQYASRNFKKSDFLNLTDDDLLEKLAQKNIQLSEKASEQNDKPANDYYKSKAINTIDHHIELRPKIEFMIERDDNWRKELIRQSIRDNQRKKDESEWDFADYAK